MDAGQLLWWYAFLLAAVLGVGLVGLGLVTAREPEARFRLLAFGTLFLFVGTGMLLGFGAATAILAGLLWMLGIVAGPAVETEPGEQAAAHH